MDDDDEDVSDVIWRLRDSLLPASTSPVCIREVLCSIDRVAVAANQWGSDKDLIQSGLSAAQRWFPEGETAAKFATAASQFLQESPSERRKGCAPVNACLAYLRSL